MSLTLKTVILEAEKIRFKIDSGELIDGCCMSAINTLVTESWRIADELTKQNQLSAEESEKLFSMLDEETQTQLLTSGYDDFDLVYEYFLHKIDNESS